MRNDALEKTRIMKTFLKVFILISTVACLMGFLAVEALAVEPVEFYPDQGYSLPFELYPDADIVDVLADDFNGDGYCDIVACGDYGSENGRRTERDSFIAILFNQGDGTFGEHVLYHMPSNGVRNMALGDFNEDGKPDLAVVDFVESGVRVLLNQGDGVFDPDLSVHYSTGVGREYVNLTAWNTPAAVAASDFDQDGHLDLAVNNDLEGKLCFLMGDGTGGFSPGSDNFADIPLGFNSYNMIAHDLFRLHDWEDGYPDLVLAGDFKVNILKNTGGNIEIIDKPMNTNNTGRIIDIIDGEIITANEPFDAIFGTGPVIDVVAGQFDYDTGHDIIAGNYSMPHYPLRAFVKNYLNEDLSVVRVEFHNGFAHTGGTTAFAVGDFNGDGYPDLVRQIGDGPVGMHIMLGLPRTPSGYITGYDNMHFQDNGIISKPDFYDNARPICTAVGDFDNNGRSDVVTGFRNAYDGAEIKVSLTKYLLPLTDITVTGTGGVSGVQVGSTLQMLADVLPANATDKSVTWCIESGSGATINPDGLLTATAEGSVTVRATANDGSGVYGEKTVTITASATVTDAAISSDTGSFDMYSPADIQTTITWNSASAVTDITVGGTSIGVDKYDITDIDGDSATLRIHKEYLAMQPTGSLVLTIVFDTGEAAEFTIDILDSTPPLISPVSASYDLDALGDVTTTITWNSASTVTDVVYSTNSLVSGTDYTVTGSALTINNSFLSDLTPSVNDDLLFDICFDSGDSATLTVNVVENHIPSADTDLSGLMVGGSTISGFDADITSYSVELPYGTSPGSAAAWVNAVPHDLLAQVDITQVSVLPGTAMVTVTAEDGTTEVYTISFTIGTSPVTTYSITASAGRGGAIFPSGTVSVTEGSNQTFTITPNSGYRINSVTVDGTKQGAITTYTFNQVTTSHAIDATFSGKGGGDSSPSAPSTPASPEYKASVKEGNGPETTIPIVVDQEAGTGFMDADYQRFHQDGTIITAPSIADVNTYAVGLSVSKLSTLDSRGTLALDTEVGSITVPSNMLTGVSGISGSKAEIAIGQGDKNALPADVKAGIGDRPLISLTLSIDGKQTDWRNPTVPVKVCIPYQPTATELANPEGIVIWYIDGSGNVVSVPNGRYDPVTGTVTFATTHFSDYAVAFRQMSFNDVAKDAWYAKAVSFIAAREITAGTGGGHFSPAATLTRGQFIVMLMKAYSIAPDANPQDNFADAGSTFYTDYLAAAKRLGLSAGVGGNLFAPEKEITRQEMFTLLYNALKVIGQLPETHGGTVSESDDEPESPSGKRLSDFDDAHDIAPWAREAMALLVERGIISGSGDRLSPTDTTTRAQMAQVLYNLMSRLKAGWT